MKYFAAGCVFWGLVISGLFLLRSRSRLHAMTIENMDAGKKGFVVFAAGIVIAACILPMGLSPVWNGQIPDHRNQYEVMAESILNGHLYMDYGEIDKQLLEMENPYDYERWSQLGVNYPWDHAFFNGHYYMYFGVVPVFLIFLPYRVITGASLTTYHATQIFVLCFIIGVFTLFYVLAKRFFPRITLIMYVLLASSFSVVSVWYSIEAPALYCTANTAGLCMEIWSIVFFVKAVWGRETFKKSILYAFFGSMFGALAFGCRPPVALANLLVLPMLAEFLRNYPIVQHSKKKESAGQRIVMLCAAAMPYVAVGLLLMMYNYMRFQNPFEFGQSYQLTLADQSSYGSIWSRFDLIGIWNGILWNFISYVPLKHEFPYLSFNGALVNFPIMCFAVIGLMNEEVRKALKENKIWSFTIVLSAMPIIITVADLLWSPELNERYRMDIYWLMGLLCYVIIGFCYMNKTEGSKKKFSCIMSYLAVMTLFACFLLYLVPNDSNITEYNPMVLEIVGRVLRMGY